MTITGDSAESIADSVRSLVDRGDLVPGQQLPPVRALSGELGVHRNTVVSAYQRLTATGTVSTRGRAGTIVSATAPVPEEGLVHEDAQLRDIGHGNPGTSWLPDPRQAFARLADREAPSVLYGSEALDADVERWARQWIATDQPREFDLVLTAGAVDAVERLLAQSLTRGDAVALEDPCFLTSINSARLAGYRTLPVPVDAEGMTPDGLRAALEAGARAVVCTPRAHNPTGASLTASRAAELRDVLSGHRHVLVVEDDHFSRLSTSGYHSIIGDQHHRWALVRSVSKFLGPDLRLAVVAADRYTVRRLRRRLSPGTTWVSHILQRIVTTMLDDDTTADRIREAGEHYARRNADFVQAFDGTPVAAVPGDGLNVWLTAPGSSQVIASRLSERGWRVRTGDEFSLTETGSDQSLRLTVHDLGDAELQMLAEDILAVVAMDS
jgi:DNA-binding transcriptional MocR family regulator